jgi:hypothetical protein
MDNPTRIRHPIRVATGYPVGHGLDDLYDVFSKDPVKL